MPRKPPRLAPLHGAKRPSRQLADQRRGSAASRGYGARWRRARKAYLAEHPFCVDCQAEHVVTLATAVDHEVPHRGDETLFWDESNWRSRCKMHHDRKTATRDGGFGNPRVRSDRSTR
jgi:5-methylcytosine-specific restriction protein A